MESYYLRETSIKTKVYLGLCPLILLGASVWFTADDIALKLGMLFQVYISILLYFLSGFFWSQLRFKNANKITSLSFYPFFLASGGGLLTFGFNPVYGLTFILLGFLVVGLVKIPDRLINLYPVWFKKLLYKSNVMICICLVVMLAFWLNPYSEPLKSFIK